MALVEARRCAELSPGWTTATFYEALALFEMGRHAEARSLLHGITVEWAGRGAEATLALCNVALGDRTSAQESLTDMRAGQDHFAEALVRLALGDVDGAFERFAAVDRLTDWPCLAIHHLYREVWNGVRSDRRYRELVRLASASLNLESPEEYAE